ncbi:MAG: methyltransferase domain-containing protein [Solirubrobacteraceae bacterium]
MRHRVRLRAACAPRSPSGRDRQLRSSARNGETVQAEFGLEFPLLHGSAEELPLPDQSFDLAISEYGASIWCDPYRWIPEAARLVRPGGRLIFLVNGALLMLCAPDE